MKKLLFHLDTDPLPSVFDTVVAYDGGADHVTPFGGIAPENVGPLVDGAIFTRPPKEKRYTALFISGSSLEAGERLLEAVQKKFFAYFRVSVMLDSNGSNTTAAAAVAQLVRAGPVAGKRAVVLAGTGPVGQRVAVLLAQEGAEVVLTSRKQERAENACTRMGARYGVSLKPAVVSDEDPAVGALEGAHIVVGAGAAGVQLLSAQQWQDHPTIEMMSDANATPPLGFEGIDMMDKGVERHGKLVFGAIGVGVLKLQLHRTCIGRLFERNDRILDIEETYSIAKTIV